MNEIVVPMLDSGETSWVVDQMLSMNRNESVLVHLLNVQRPLPRHVAQFFNRNDLRDFHQDAGMRVLEQAAQRLEAAGIAHETHVLVGHPAEAIVRFAEARRGRKVVMQAPAHPVLSALGLGSIGSQVHHLLQSRATNPAASVKATING